jgi:hypothetical protein
MKGVHYRIDGKIDAGVLKEIPEEMELKVYAVRERRVLGTSKIELDGSYSIRYKYQIHREQDSERKHAMGPYLIAGPDLPGDTILKHKFPAVFLPPENFKMKEDALHATIGQNIANQIINKEIIVAYLKPWWKLHSYEWRPCLELLACSRIESGLCYDQEPLSNMHVRIYQRRFPRLWLTGSTPREYTVLVSEGDTDSFGYYRDSETYYLPWILLWRNLGYIVEVGQIIDGAFVSLYKEPYSEIPNDICQRILIEKTQVITPESPEGLLTGNTFKLTRIGNIPVGYINQNSASPFHGYANTLTAADSATLPVIDSAFYSTLKLYANIGAGILNTVKYYRIKYAYEANGTHIESYLQAPFYNTRETTDEERPVYGPYKTEFMGPTGGYYTYPNPYDLAADKQWVYKGLIMVLNTATLPLPYGKFTLTLEPLDAGKNPVAVDNPADLACTILVDNTGPAGSLGDIIGPGEQTVPACGFLTLPSVGSRAATCYGSPATRNVVQGEISVPFSATDEHGNIHSIVLSAEFGCNESYVVVNSSNSPTAGCGGAAEYQDYNDVPNAQRPDWHGRSDYCGARDGTWDECAYQFRLWIYKRLTNGEVAYPRWEFTKHITIMHSS